MTVEIVVYNLESALKAQEGGAERIELCENPSEGGTTPSYGMIKTLRKKLSLSMYVMVRPRGGDFQYSDDEVEAMKDDIRICKELGANGVVFGILTPDGRIDRERCAALVALAAPMKATCHRAFDMTRDPYEALEDCIAAGFERILTAGQQAQAQKGIALIGELVQKAKGRISIMPGSGVNETCVKEIVSKTGVKEIHFSAGTTRSSTMVYRNEKIAGMGADEGSEFKVRTLDPSRIALTRRLAEEALRDFNGPL